MTITKNDKAEERLKRRVTDLIAGGAAWLQQLGVVTTAVQAGAMAEVNKVNQ